MWPYNDICTHGYYYQWIRVLRWSMTIHIAVAFAEIFSTIFIVLWIYGVIFGPRIHVYSISQEICTRFCCALLCCGYAGTGAIVRLPQCQWSKPDGYGKISQWITTTKHSKAKTVCIFLGIYCSWWAFDGLLRIINCSDLADIMCTSTKA